MYHFATIKTKATIDKQCTYVSHWFHTPCVRLLASDVKDLHSKFIVWSVHANHGPLVHENPKRTKTKIDYIALDQGGCLLGDKEASTPS